MFAAAGVNDCVDPLYPSPTLIGNAVWEGCSHTDTTQCQGSCEFPTHEVSGGTPTAECSSGVWVVATGSGSCIGMSPPFYDDVNLEIDV